MVKREKSLKKDTHKLWNFLKQGFFKCYKENILRNKKIKCRKTICFLVETIEVLFRKVFFVVKDMIFPCTNFWKEYFGSIYVSVLKSIPDINRKKSTRLEEWNLMFSLLYYTKPKTDFFFWIPCIIELIP